jgi:hypothetical protein
MLCAAFVAFVAVSLAGPASADEIDARELTAAEVKRHWHGRLDGRHFAAVVQLELDLGGLRETRELRIFRDDESGREERLLVRFTEPADLRGFALLYLEQDGRPNDYFLYQPSARRVRRLPESVADDDVYGIDLEFLGFGVAQTEPTEIESLATEKVLGRECYRLTERALERNPRFDTRVTWIDRTSFVALRTRHLRGDKVVLEAETLELRDIDGVPTPVRMSFRHTDAGSVELLVREVDYASPIPDEYFSIMALVRASTDD